MDYDIYTFLVDWLNDMCSTVLLHELISGHNVFVGPAWKVADTAWATKQVTSIEVLTNMLVINFRDEEEE